MTDLRELRRQNLKSKIQERGGVAAVSRSLGYKNPSYLSNLVTGRKTLGERAARAIEAKLRLPALCLDQRPGEAPPFAGTDRALLASAVRAVGAALEKRGLARHPKFAELVALVYEQAVAAGGIDDAHLDRLLTLL